MNLFFIGVFFLHALINVYIFYRSWQALPKFQTPRLIFTIVYIFFFTSFVFAMLGRNTLPLGVQKFLYFVGTTWLAVMLYITFYLLLTDLIYFLNRFFHYLPKKWSANPKSFRKIQISIGYGIILLLLITGYFKFTHPVIIEQEIVINKSAGKHKELKVAGISDIHLGTTVDKKRLAKYVELINKQKPDIVIIAGDLIDNNLLPLIKEKMWEELNLLDAPLGVYYCLGNHEYLSGIEPSMDFLQKTNMKILIDDACLVDNSLWIIGRDDIHGAGDNRKNLEELVQLTDTTLPLLLLDHEPYHLEEAEMNGIDLQFSGHTHNGQLWPLNLIVKQIYEVGYGYKQKGSTHYYISSGLALWGPPYRIGTESELVIFNIKFN